MFGRGSIVLRILGTLVLIGVLVAAGALIFQAGQAQGYALGLAASGKVGQNVAPAVPAPYPYYPGYWGPGFLGPRFFFPFGPLFGLLFFGGVVFFFFVVGGLFRARRWGGGYGPYGPRERPEGAPEERGQEPSEGGR
jgi:hypothetical protein